MQRVFWLLIALVAGCTSQPTKPQIVEVPGPVRYVPIDSKLTAHPPLPPLVNTSPAQCPAVANERLWLLNDAYLKLDAIGNVQGTNVP